MKKIFILGSMLFALFAVSTVAYAQEIENQDAAIVVSEPLYDRKGMILEATVTFNNRALYNDSIFFSYHIERSDGEMLIFENPRYPVELDEQGTGKISFSIAYKSLPQEESFNLCFDLVDQKNAYWYSYRTDIIKFSAPKLEVNRSEFPQTKNDEEAVVTITTDELECGLEQATIQAIVQFHDTSYYNDSIYLSYHIFDSSQNLLQFENQRIQVVLDGSNKAVIPIAVSLLDLQNFDSMADLIFELDLVDQKNAFWFSGRSDLAFSTSSFSGEKMANNFSNILSLQQQNRNYNEISPEMFENLGRKKTISPNLIYGIPAGLLLVFGAAVFFNSIRKKSLNLKGLVCRKKRALPLLFRHWCKEIKYVLPVGSFPAVFLFCNNPKDVALLPGMAALAVCSVISAVILAIMLLFWEQSYKAALASSIGLILFWNYNSFEGILRSVFPQCYYWHVIIVEITIYLLLLWTIAVIENVTILPIVSQVIGIVFSCLIAFNIVISVPQFVEAWGQGVNMESTLATVVRREPESPPDTVELPNVYLFVFDEYSSSEMINKYYGFDNSTFENALEEMGFQYSHGSRYGYAGTIYGLQSTLNMEYATKLTVAALTETMENGKVFQLFRDYGYTTIQYSAGLSVPENDMIKVLFQQSIMMPVFRSKSYDYCYNGNVEYIELIKGLDYIYNAHQPTLSYFYFSLPHAPYVFDKDGKRIPNQYALDYFSDYAYLGQYQYANKIMLEMASIIIEQDPNAIIMFQSDHSMRWMYSYHDGFYPDYCEILNAIYFQGETPFNNNGLNGANTLRQVANHILGLEFPLLEKDYED